MTPLNLKDHYEYLAKQIEREDGLVNTRIGWLLTFEGFLFTAFGIMSKDLSSMQGKILWLIPIADMAMAVLAFLGINVAISALDNLKNKWTETLFILRVIFSPLVVIKNISQQ